MNVQISNFNYSINCKRKHSCTESKKIFLLSVQQPKNCLVVKTSPIFKGYKGFKCYGQESDRNAVNYAFKNTPLVIDETILKAKTRDSGITKSYENLYNQDAKGILGALDGLSNILKDYDKTYIKRCDELKLLNPEGTEGFFNIMKRTNIIKNTPKLFDETKKHLIDLGDDLGEIMTHYWDNGILDLVAGFSQSSEHLKSKLYRGYPAHEEIKEQIDLSYGILVGKACDTKNDFTKKYLDPDKVSENIQNVLNYQEKRQMKKFFLGPVIGSIVDFLS